MGKTKGLTILNIGQNYYIRGGSDQYFFALTNLLEQHGHCIIPFAARNQQNLPTPWGSYFPGEVDFSHPGARDLIRFIYYRQAAKNMARMLYNQKVDIAHLHIYYGKLTTSILEPLKKADVPVVQTLHEYRLVCPVSNLYAHGNICEDCRGHAFWHAILKRCNRGKLSRSILSAIEAYVSSMMGSVSKIDHFIAVSDFLRSKLIELGIPADKITTVHNFIDVSNIAPSHNKGAYFLYFGRLEKIKGIFTLLEAVAPLKDIPLFIAGEGEARGLVGSYIEKHSLNHVKLIGFKKGTELDELIRNSICTITPSEWFETFGLTLIESFARGRPVIASNIGGMSEVVSDSSDGFLIPPKNADMLRDKMIWFWLHRNEAIEMGRSGRKKVEVYFNPDIHYERIMHIYKNLI